LNIEKYKLSSGVISFTLGYSLNLSLIADCSAELKQPVWTVSDGFYK